MSGQPGKNREGIEIRLPHSRFSHAYSKVESLWKKEIERMLDLIETHLAALEKASKMEDRYSTDMIFLSIALFGTYGAGKSSLLRTFVRRIKHDELGDSKNHRHISNKIHSLDVIEPNLLAPDDQFLYAFLAAALQEDMVRHQQEYQSFRDSQILSPVQQKFHEVSEYLQALDAREQHPDFDPLGVSLERLDRHTSGMRLQSKMREFVDVLADSLCGSDKKSVIVLPVDDADMSLEGLVSTLDTMRRYLQHPRLVPVFTFTGRLAEELLQVHFAKKLTLGETSKQEYDERLREASTELSIAENLAIQYLGKLFPVRNRIKLGFGAARLQKANFEVPIPSSKRAETEGNTRSNQIFTLLETASRIMFGCPEWPVLPIVRSPLRSSTLRRQLQIVDAMQESKVDIWMPDNAQKGKGSQSFQPEYKGPANPSLSWAEMFDRASWSLLNVHRDVLKEYQLNLDDLYSWTPMGLRQVILISILDQGLAKRRKLIKQWRYRTEDRRSQMLSLLAANAFRPRMYREELTGDDPRSLQKEADGGVDENQANHYWYMRSFSIRKGSIWFFQVWIGFYLPQALARNRDPSRRGVPSVSGVGWTLRSGPIHALREALHNGTVHSTGMMFLDPEAYQKQVKDLVANQKGCFQMLFKQEQADSPKGQQDKLPRHPVIMDPFAKPVKVWHNLLLELWTYFGSDSGGVFAATSFWRGMGLLTSLLKADVNYRESSDETEQYELLKAKIDRSEQEERQFKDLRLAKIEPIKSILFTHLKEANVLGTPSNRHLTKREKHRIEARRKKHTMNDLDIKSFGQWKFDDINYQVRALAEDILDWLETFLPNKYRIKPMAPFIFTSTHSNQSSKANGVKTNTSGQVHESGPVAKSRHERAEWKACFIRRIHGESIMSQFWQYLDSQDEGELNPKWQATESLVKWAAVLQKYWDCGREFNISDSNPSASQNMTQTLLMECPFVKPFSISEKDFNSVVKKLETCKTNLHAWAKRVGSADPQTEIESKRGEAAVPDKTIPENKAEKAADANVDEATKEAVEAIAGIMNWDSKEMIENVKRQPSSVKETLKLVAENFKEVSRPYGFTNLHHELESVTGKRFDQVESDLRSAEIKIRTCRLHFCDLEGLWARTLANDNQQSFLKEVSGKYHLVLKKDGEFAKSYLGCLINDHVKSLDYASFCKARSNRDVVPPVPVTAQMKELSESFYALGTALVDKLDDSKLPNQLITSQLNFVSDKLTQYDNAVSFFANLEMTSDFTSAAKFMHQQLGQEKIAGFCWPEENPQDPIEWRHHMEIQLDICAWQLGMIYYQAKPHFELAAKLSVVKSKGGGIRTYPKQAEGDDPQGMHPDEPVKLVIDHKIQGTVEVEDVTQPKGD